MTFLAVISAAILGIFTGKFVYLMTERKRLAVGSQFNVKSERVYNGIK